MDKKFREYAPNQILLLPPSLNEWLPEGHLVHFFNEVIGELDLSGIYGSYQELRGKPPYEPKLMVKILLYAMSKRIHSSRKIEAALYDDVAFRYLAGNQQPDHWTISEFRRRHHQALGDLFAQTVTLAGKVGLVNLRHTATDGTKIKANASKHSAMSYRRMQSEEERLRQEIEQELRRMEETDRAENKVHGGRRGDELPEALSTVQKRREAIRQAKAALEEEAREKARKDQAKRAKEATKEGRQFKARTNPEDAKPKAKSQRNFTDPESKIMKNSDKAFIQAYNAQATVDAHSHIIVAAEVSNVADDSPHLPGQIEQVIANTDLIPREVLADAGYYSEDNMVYLAGREIPALIPPEKIRHSQWRTMTRPEEPLSDSATPKERMSYALRTEAGRATYKLRQQSVEPIFGYIKEQLGLRQFLLRGIDKVRSLWRMACAVSNLMKLYRAGFRPMPAR
jgi:transposase